MIPLSSITSRKWFVAWQLAYITTLAEGGVDLATADAVVGTSAGSILGSLLTSGRLAQGANIFQWFGENSEFMSQLIVVNTGAESQLRARKIQQTTKSHDQAAIQAMGRASMAAKNAPVEEELEVVRKSGSEVFVTFANPPKGTNFLDPKEMEVAARMGAARAKEDLAALSKLWK